MSASEPASSQPQDDKSWVLTGDDREDDDDALLEYALLQPDLDDLIAEANANWPSIKDWTDINRTEHIVASLGRTQERVLKLAMKEFRSIWKMFEEEFGMVKPSIRQLVDHTIGPKSKSMRFFTDQLGWSPADYTSFIRKFTIQSAYGTSVTELYDDDEYLEKTTLAPKDDFIRWWKEVGTACLPSNEKKSPAIAPEALWMKIEGTINNLLWSLAVESMIAGKDDPDIDLDEIRVTFNDDKMHFEG